MSPFNSPVETGTRALILLSKLYPLAVDLQRILSLDYLMIHSADAGGPESLHPPLPLRTGELLVRRGLLETALSLLLIRGLVSREVSSEGILYAAADEAGPFVHALATPYAKDLQDRADWVIETFGHISTADLQQRLRRLFDQWTSDFESAPQQRELLS